MNGMMTFSPWKREKKENWTVCVWLWKSGRSWCLPFDSTEAWGFGEVFRTFSIFHLLEVPLEKIMEVVKCESIFWGLPLVKAWWYDDMFQWIRIPIEGDWSHELWGSALLEPPPPKPYATFGVLAFAEFTEKPDFLLYIPPKTRVDPS